MCMPLYATWTILSRKLQIASVQSSHLRLSRLDTLRFRDLTQIPGVPGPPPENDTAVVTSETLGECSQQSTDLQTCIRLSANLAPPLFQNCFQTGKWQDMLRQYNLNETWSRAKAVACGYFQIWQIHSLPHLKHHAKPPSHSVVVACSGTLMYGERKTKYQTSIDPASRVPYSL